MVCFNIIEEGNTKDNKYRDTRLAWTKLSKSFEPTKRASKKILSKKSAK